MSLRGGDGAVASRFQEDQDDDEDAIKNVFDLPVSLLLLLLLVFI